MPGLTQLDLRNFTRRLVCISGETIFGVVPQNRIGRVGSLHIDASYASGLTDPIRIQLLDVFATIDTGAAETSSSVIRFQTTVEAGSSADIPLREPIPMFGSIRVDSDFSGPIVSLGTAYL